MGPTSSAFMGWKGVTLINFSFQNTLQPSEESGWDTYIVLPQVLTQAHRRRKIQIDIDEKCKYLC